MSDGKQATAQGAGGDNPRDGVGNHGGRQHDGGLRPRGGAFAVLRGEPRAKIQRMEEGQQTDIVRGRKKR